MPIRWHDGSSNNGNSSRIRTHPRPHRPQRGKSTRRGECEHSIVLKISPAQPSHTSGIDRDAIVIHRTVDKFGCEEHAKALEPNLTGVNMQKAIAIVILAAALAGCDAVNTMTEGFKHAKAVEADIWEATGVKPAVGFSWNNGQLTSVTVSFPKLY